MANSKPRVLIAAGIYPPDPGGPAIHAKAQFDELRGRGRTVRLVALSHYRGFPILLRHAVYFLRLVGLTPASDVVYAHDALGVGVPALIAAKIFGKKIMIRVGGDIPWERQAESGKTRKSMKEWYADGEHRLNIWYKISSIFLKNFDAVVVTTQLLADVYVQYYGVPSDKIHVVLNPVPAKKVPAGTGKDIVYASRLVAYKNLDFVIRVLAPILRNHPGTRLLILGDGPERSNLERAIWREGMEEQILLKGIVSQQEVMDLTEKSLFCIAPALTEFNPNYILQCISYGKPFLISRENGMPFDVPDTLVFDPRDPHELESGVLNLLDKKGYAEASSEVQRLPLDMTWDKNLDMNISIIDSLIA